MARRITVPAASAHRLSAVAPALLAAIFGVFIVLGVGFADSSTIHNAAHDARHSFSFPCH
ncbi:MAG: CbtB domain-containing protein [Rhodospirillales bacterium]